MQPKARVNVKNLQRKLNRLSRLGTVNQRKDAVLIGLKLVTERAVEILRANKWWITGTLAGSITEEVVAEGENVRGRVGTNLVYARRVELGFIGTDKLGRKINQRARPYLRRAYAERLNEIVDTIASSLRAIIENSV